MKIARNALCHCGSGLKYKKCCMQKEDNHVIEIHDDYLFMAGKIKEATHYKRNGDLFNANKIYEELSELYPNNENIQYNWAKIKTLIGDYDEAIELYKKSLKKSLKIFDLQGVKLCKAHIEKIKQRGKNSREFIKYLREISGNHSLKIEKIRKKYRANQN